MRISQVVFAVAAIAAIMVIQLPAAQSEGYDDAKQLGCLNCHTIPNKLVGPSWMDVAAKYAIQSDASAYLADRILKGSYGVWGPIPMPPNANLRPDQSRQLADFIMTLK